MMYVKESDNFMHCVEHALNAPIATRCAELTVLFDRGTMLELQHFFPILINNIFGPDGTVSWDLRNTYESDGETFRQLQHFLSPCGPLFKLIYNLLKDPSAKYDYPVGLLPLKIQQILEHAEMHPFYASLIHLNPQTKRITSLLLNPFDYYIFHFAYHLINPWHQRTPTAQKQFWTTVYYVLSCDYFLHFLPTNPNVMVLPKIYYSGKNPITFHPQQIINRSPSQLIRTPITYSLEEYNFNISTNNSRNENWRSESILRIFIDLWLNDDRINRQDNLINNTFNNLSNTMRMRKYNELPTNEFMRILRVLIKQLHAFSASAKMDQTEMKELKQTSLSVVENQMYVCLRNLIYRWPLDGSFRLVLELWLTYIQPWRYPPENLNLNQDLDDFPPQITKEISPDFLPFIAGNLLTYIIIFQQLLPRFTRVDLISPKMAVMLYRITKVFNQTNLPELLKECEKSVDLNDHTIKYSYKFDHQLPPLNPSTNWSTTMDSNHFMDVRKCGVNNKWSGLIRQKISELEGPQFRYRPLFADKPPMEIYDLIQQIRKSIDAAGKLIELKRKEQDDCYGSFWGLFRLFWNSDDDNDEFTLNERLKVPAYLETSLENLVELFDLKDIPDCPNELNTLDVGDLSRILSPQAVRERMKKIKYDGDPDLIPVRSFENKYLVRLLYRLSLYLNRKYADQFCQIYYKSNYFGRLSRQILSPPITIYHYDKTRIGSPRLSRDLPPRITFRIFANYSILIYLIFGYFSTKFCGFNLFIYLTILIFIYSLFIIMKAIPKKNSVRHNYPIEGFGNISFNDSF